MPDSFGDDKTLAGRELEGLSLDMDEAEETYGVL